MMTAPSTAMRAVAFSAAAPIVSAALIVLPLDMTLAEPSRKRCQVDFLWVKAKMLAAFEEVWASGWSLLPIADPSSAPLLQLVTPLIAVPAPDPPAVLIAVSVASVAPSSAHSGSSSRSAASSSQSREWFLRSPGSRLVPVHSPSVPAPAARGSWSHSRSRRPSGTRSLSWAPSVAWSRCQASSSTRLASSTHLGSACSSSKRLWAGSRRSSSSRQSWDSSSSQSRPRSPAWVQASSSSVVPFAVESRSPSDSVSVSYSSCTSYYRRSPLVAPSHAGFCTRSPVSKGRHSQSMSCFRSHWSQAARAGSSQGSCLGSFLISPVIRDLPLDHLPGAGLLLLMVRDVVFVLACGLRLGAQMRTVKGGAVLAGFCFCDGALVVPE